MEKLNELVESAKETAAIYGAEWDNALSKYPDGVVQFEVVSTEGETVVTTGRDKKSDSWLCDYLVHCSPANILAIVEAFRALEQRAEAAEAELEVERDIHDDTVQAMHLWCERAKEAEAKLAELEKQEPAGKFAFEPLAERYHHIKHGEAQHMEPKLTLVKLFTRPAPAINLAELVPVEWTNEQCLEFLSIAFRHAEISGDIEMDDIRQAVKMVNAGAKNH